MVAENQGCVTQLVPIFKVVSQNQVMVIERLGRFNRKAESGLNILYPFIDRPRMLTSRYVIEDANGLKRVITRQSAYVDLREQVLDFPRQSVITADNVAMEINALLYYRIVDPIKAVYEIANFAEAIEKLTQTTLRNVVGELTLDDTLSSRDRINARLLTILDEATNSWGVDVTRVELQDIMPPPEIRQTMELQMTAERQKRAELLNAEAAKQSAILQAEGKATARVRDAESQRDAEILDAEGRANAAEAIARGEAKARLLSAEAETQALKMMTDVIGQEAAIQYMIGQKYLRSLEKMADGQATKTFIPYEAAGALGAVGSLKEMLNNNNGSS